MNNITDNWEYAYYNSTDNLQLAQNNWWGTATAGQIPAMLYDHDDSSSFGVIDYTPFLVAPATAPRPTIASGVVQITSLRASTAGSGAGVIVYSLSAPAEVQATITNIAGVPVKVLPPQQAQAGTQALLWSGQSDNGTKAPAGRYLVTLVARTSDGATSRALTALNWR